MANKTDTPAETSSAADSPQPQSTARAAPTNRIESHTVLQHDSADARRTLIAEAAYHRAQQRGFAAGEDWQDWFEAEREVDALLDPDL